ncbi:hypothetical protein PPIS_a1024 [Pseudoalteromonas piscicida]|uniref:Uncharacterized protein n=1 Tax=Pseudoalteromonas piscicida TaxID=43662 RepID=A0ABN5CG62_PSEO7|nr:hypothetical protein PPIS_a1024 [Pseudoalteromonas piscicida]
MKIATELCNIQLIKTSQFAVHGLNEGESLSTLVHSSVNSVNNQPIQHHHLERSR